MVLDDAGHHGETQPGSPLGLLGREVRLEDPSLGLDAHARTIVGDIDPHRAPAIGQARLGAVGIPGTDGDSNAPLLVPDCVRRVGDEVHQHLMELTRERADGRYPAGHLELELDQLGHRRAGQLDGLRRQRRDRGRSELLCLGTTESEDSTHQIGRAVGGGLHLVENLVDYSVARQLVPGERDVPGDGKDEVVEVVGDAPRQGAEGLQLLGVDPPFLLLGPSADVDEDPREADRTRGPAAANDDTAQLLRRQPHSQLPAKGSGTGVGGPQSVPQNGRRILPQEVPETRSGGYIVAPRTRRRPIELLRRRLEAPDTEVAGLQRLM